MFGGGYQPDIVGSGNGHNGAVFITDIEPQNSGDNVGGKVFSSGGRVLDQCVSNTGAVTIHVLAITGNTHFQPGVTVEGQAVTLVQDEDQSVWTGTINLDITGLSSVTAQHEDGPTHACQIVSDAGPEILSVVFTGGYPSGQTELKAGDTFDVRIVSDAPMTQVEFADFGAASAQNFDFTASTDETVTVTIADRGNIAQALGVRVRARNANGSYGGFIESASTGSVDGTHVVRLNNLHPQITFGTIDYPSTQGALKDAESATVNHTVANFDSLAYDSPNNELSITGATTYAAAKSVSRIGGQYNVTTSNFRVTATRAANAAQSIGTTVVRIAHASPQVSIQEPATRLRSGGNQGSQPQDHVLTITTTQLLDGVPQISVPEGTLQDDAMANPNGLGFAQTLTVHDDDTKGTYSFQLVQAKNLAGRVVTTLTGDANYTIGGFVARTLTIPRFEREVAIGTEVSNTSKLIAVDKDQTGMSYANNFNNALQAYTITGPTGQLNANGNLFYWNDTQAVNNNTTGLATVTIEEEA